MAVFEDNPAPKRRFFEKASLIHGFGRKDHIDFPHSFKDPGGDRLNALN